MFNKYLCFYEFGQERLGEPELFRLSQESSSQFTSWGEPRNGDPSVTAVAGSGKSKGVPGKRVGVWCVYMYVYLCAWRPEVNA